MDLPHVKGVKTLKRTTQIKDQLEILNLAVLLTDKYGVEKLQDVMRVVEENPVELEERRSQTCTTCCAGKWMLCGNMFKASMV